MLVLHFSCTFLHSPVQKKLKKKKEKERIKTMFAYSELFTFCRLHFKEQFNAQSFSKVWLFYRKTVLSIFSKNNRALLMWWCLGEPQMTDFKNMALKPDIENIIGHSIRTIYMWYISAYKKITGFQVHSHNSFLNYIVL